MTGPITIFECGRRTGYCSAPGCTRAAPLVCTFPLVGKKAGQACGLALCNDHARFEKPDGVLCPAHQRAREAGR